MSRGCGVFDDAWMCVCLGLCVCVCVYGVNVYCSVLEKTPAALLFMRAHENNKVQIIIYKISVYYAISGRILFW